MCIRDRSQIEEGTYYSYTIVAVDKTGNESVVSKVDVLSARDEITVPIFDFTASIRSRRPIKLIATTDVSYNPVSYTHLRAHETSLHLVCRLLLEKKKIQHEN
eukprot:TRINITY_DN59226_c0_g1_i3.p3 TRINITY_DN59226_c0_g1~~TRINITY_DN59226_c0_g1_i3.p3  ORF type:complete len:103 (-),score=20.96 TRINITY_DN59226_c0_g1_i3:83-391(-)